MCIQIYTYCAPLNISGLTKPIEQKELLRRAHLTFPDLLSQELLDSIKPDLDELRGANALTSRDYEKWQTSLTQHERSQTVVVRVQGSSDCVTPQNTLSSTVRAVMGSLDNLYSPSLGLTVPIPETPCFLIGVYKGEENKDDLVLKTVVAELEDYAPPLNFRYPIEGKQTSKTPITKQIYFEFSYWVADAIERCALCGTLGHAGYASCPRCTLLAKTDVTEWQKQNMPESLLVIPPKKTKKGSDRNVDNAAGTNKKRWKKQFPYFTSVEGDPRKDKDWDSYTEKIQGEVCIVYMFWYYFLVIS